MQRMSGNKYTRQKQCLCERSRTERGKTGDYVTL